MEKIINVTAYPYNAVPDYDKASGEGTDNRAAFQSALNDAINTESKLYIPAGNYRINITADNIDDPGKYIQTPLKVAEGKKIVIYGDGMDLTFVKLGPQRSPEATIGLLCENGSDVMLQGIQLEGPNIAPEFMDTWLSLYKEKKDNWNHEMIVHNGAGALRIYDCRTTGGIFAIKAYGGSLVTTSLITNDDKVSPIIECCNCDLSAGGINIICSPADLPSLVTEGELRVVGCTFNLQSILNSTLQAQHNIYISEGWSLFVDGCRFETANQDEGGENIYYHVGESLPSRPNYAIISNSFFEPSAWACIRSNEFIKTLINNCDFQYHNSIYIRKGGVQVTNCRFISDGSGGAAVSEAPDEHAYDDNAAAFDDCTFVNCTFEGGNNSTPGGPNAQFYINRWMENNTALWKFMGCSFGGKTKDETGISIDAGVALTGGSVSHTQCQPDGEVGYGNLMFESCDFNACGNDIMRIEAGKLVVRNCRILADQDIVIFHYTTNDLGDVDLEFSNNYSWSTAAGGGLYIMDNPCGYAVTVRGENNHFTGTQGPKVDSAKSNVRGWLRPPVEIGKRIELELTLDKSHQIDLQVSPSANAYHIKIQLIPRNPEVFASTIPTIRNIWLQPKGASGWANKIYFGPFYFIVDNPFPGESFKDVGQWKVDDSGNIQPKTTATRPYKGGITLIYDTDEGCWYEV